MVETSLKAMTTHGELTFSKWAEGKWVVFFSHPADFTPVCSTELTEFAKRNAEFDKRINHNDLLGKYFLTHCFGGASAVMPNRFDKSLSVDSDWATDFCGTEEFIRSKGLWAGSTIYNNTSDQALPIALGRTHGSWRPPDRG